jgi:hypothetical protein
MHPLAVSLKHQLQALGLVVVTAVAAALVPATSAQATAMVTIVEGEATLVDGARALVAVEGLKVGDETLVRTGPSTTLLRLEWPDGTAADFGPDTQAMVEPGGFGKRSGRAPAVYLLRGWLKLSSLGQAATPGALSARVDLAPFKGSLVMMAVGDETWVFAEGGSGTVGERHARPPVSLALRPGEVYARSGAAKGAVAPRPSPSQMQRVPRGFRDTLPLRSAALQGRSVAIRNAPPPAYAELREWLTAEMPLRRGFTRRFAERARDGAFRAGLVEHLVAHPEWEPVLFPERFVKPASAPR